MINIIIFFILVNQTLLFIKMIIKDYLIKHSMEEITIVKYLPQEKRYFKSS